MDTHFCGAVLRALAACGITIDSSLFAGYALCGLNGVSTYHNTPSRWEYVIEIPTSVTRNSCKARVRGRKWTSSSMIKKVDPDWAGLLELKRQVLALKDAGLDPLVIMLHSYALLDVGHSFRPVPEAEEKFRALISWLAAQEELVLTTLGQYVDRIEHGSGRIRVALARVEKKATVTGRFGLRLHLRFGCLFPPSCSGGHGVSPLTLFELTYTIVFSYLVGLFTFLPLRLGPRDVTFVYLLTLLGAPTDIAWAALVQRALRIVIPLGLGLISMAILGFDRLKPSSNSEPETGSPFS